MRRRDWSCSEEDREIRRTEGEKGRGMLSEQWIDF
jgi:hypothetical protein